MKNNDGFSGREWSGPFHHPDTRPLLNLNPSWFSPDRFREKRWCYVGIIHPDIIFGCAVIHLGYMASAFAFGFDRKASRMIEHAPVFFPLGQVSFDRNPDHGVASYQSLRGRLRLTRDRARSRRTVRANFYLPGRSLKADIDITDPEGGFLPMHFHLPMEKGRSAFTTKAAGLTAKGSIRLNGKTFDLDPGQAFAVFDWTDGFYPRRTSWNWACGAGLAKGGARVGFNFSSGVYEKGLLENTLWINGKPEKTGEAFFAYDPENPSLPWRIKSRDGLIDLTFTPEGIRRAHDDLLILKSFFIQPCGSFEGSVRTKDGLTFRFSGLGGVVEEHHATW
nr:DUF2804 domain-containing protein [Desulfobacula sp.]